MRKMRILWAGLLCLGLNAGVSSVAIAQFAAAAPSGLSQDLPSSKLIGSCDFYRALSKEMGCGPDSYLTRFGDHYCRRFDQVHDYFSDDGNRVVEDIKICLQIAIDSVRELNCENVHAIAVQSHIGCYQQAGFCEMKVRDKAVLAQTVASSVFDPTLRGTIGKVINSCLWPTTNSAQ